MFFSSATIRIKDIKVYFSKESYNEEQEIESIILRTSNFFTKLISFPAFSTVLCYIILS